jgi:hypothetical protein
MEKVTQKLRVVHYPQVGICPSFFSVDVKDEEEAYLIMETLANQHLWLLENSIIPDFSNIISVEIYDDYLDDVTMQPYGWVEYYNESEGMGWDEFEETYLDKDNKNNITTISKTPEKIFIESYTEPIRSCVNEIREDLKKLKTDLEKIRDAANTPRGLPI